MKLIVCTDSHNGIMFNSRRQSSDSAVCMDVFEMIGTGRLFVSEYSFRLFEKYKDSRVIQSTKSGSAAGREDFCFAEDIYSIELVHEAEMLVIYCWNKVYPADMYFDANINKMKLISETEFKGNSHEKITKRVYTR